MIQSIYISEYDTRTLPSSRLSIPLTRIGNFVIDLNHSISYNIPVSNIISKCTSIQGHEQNQFTKIIPSSLKKHQMY